MTSGGHVLQREQQTAQEHLKLLKNDELKDICKAYSLHVSGTKAVLITRVRELLDDIVARGDVRAFERFLITAKMQAAVDRLKLGGNMFPSSTTFHTTPSRMNGSSAHDSSKKLMLFKASPFYIIQDSLTPIYDLPEGEEMPANRNTVKASLKIRPELGQRLRNDSSLRIMLYCGSSHALNSHSPAHITFPNQIEVKVNGNDVKHNFKGLKGKDGSTKPADITSFLQKFGGQENQIQITYALTQKRFSYTVYQVRYNSADRLVDRIRNGNVIPKDKVLRDMSRANADPDIAATSIRMSLKDPVSTVRITLPVRSSHCTHNQCFDGAMFLQLQEQAPQWTCPVCSKVVAFESLCVDKYFEDILNRTSKSIEKVDIEPNGDWKVIKEEEDDVSNTNGTKARASYDDDFDDLVELDDDEPFQKPINGLRKDNFMNASPSTFSLPSFSMNTPPLSSREASVAQSAVSAPRSNKRPASAVIDLTLSSDDEDGPPRPAKRQSTIQSSRQNYTPTLTTSYNTPTSVTDARSPSQQHRPQVQASIHTQPPARQQAPNQQHQQQYGYNYNQANNMQNGTFRPNSGSPSFGQQSFMPNNVASHSTSISPPNAIGSPSNQQTWSSQNGRSSSTGIQQPPQQQRAAPFPPPPTSNSFSFRSPTTSTFAPNTTYHANSIGNFNQYAIQQGNHGLRLPPMSNSHQSANSQSQDAGNNLNHYNGWRNANGGSSDYESNYGSSP